MGLRHKKANVTHPTLGVTVLLPILSVKKNPQGSLYTQLGVLTKGAVIEVNVSELGLTTASGKVVWGKWAQITSEFYRKRGFVLGSAIADCFCSRQPRERRLCECVS